MTLRHILHSFGITVSYQLVADRGPPFGEEVWMDGLMNRSHGEELADHWHNQHPQWRWFVRREITIRRDFS